MQQNMPISRKHTLQNGGHFTIGPIRLFASFNKKFDNEDDIKINGNFSYLIFILSRTLSLTSKKLCPLVRAPSSIWCEWTLVTFLITVLRSLSLNSFSKNQTKAQRRRRLLEIIFTTFFKLKSESRPTHWLIFE